MGTRFEVAGAIIEIDDEEATPNVVVPLTRTAPLVGKGRGRSRLHGVCPLHGASLSGDPCDKFSHLPGNGRGIKQPNPLLFLIVICRILIKPLIICSILFGGWTWGNHIIEGGIFSAIVPSGIVGTTVPVSDANSGNVGGTIPGPNRTTPSSGIRSDCFQPSNPCGLVSPKQPVK